MVAWSAEMMVAEMVVSSVAYWVDKLGFCTVGEMVEYLAGASAAE